MKIKLLNYDWSVKNMFKSSKILFMATIFAFNLSANDGVYAVFEAKSDKEATLTTDKSGIVEVLNTDISLKVKKGDLLLKLENSREILAAEYAKTLLEQAKIKEEQAKKSYERYLKLEKLVDKEQFENVEYGYKLAKAETKKLEANLKQAQAEVEKTYLKAPFDGVVTQKYVEIGDSINSAQRTPAIKLEKTDIVKLIITFDEKHSNKVKVNSIYKYKIDGEEAIKEVKIDKIYPTIDPKKRSLSAEAHTSDGIIAGIFGDGFIEVNK